MKSTKLLKRVSSLIIPILILSACTKDNPLTDEIDGTYNLEVTGDFTESWEGNANFLQVIHNTGNTEEDGTMLTITLTKDDDNSVSIQLVKLETVSFGEGSYQFIEDPADNQVGFFVSMYHTGSAMAFVSTSGSIEITSFKNTLVEGTFDVQMNDFAGSTISVSGTFKAIGLTQNY